MILCCITRSLEHSTWVPLVPNVVCVTALNCANLEKDFAAALAAYKTASLAVNVETVVTWKGIVYRSQR